MTFPSRWEERSCAVPPKVTHCAEPSMEVPCWAHTAPSPGSSRRLSFVLAAAPCSHTEHRGSEDPRGSSSSRNTHTNTASTLFCVCVFISSYVYINKKRTKGTYEAIKDFLAYSVQASLLRLLPGIWLGFCASEHQHHLLSLGCCISITNSDESQPSQSRLVLSE